MAKDNNSPLVYCDWNVFNKLEHLLTIDGPDRGIYSEIDAKIKAGEIIVPYSNAHINDLARGYCKNPAYTPGHLQNITALTHNLCITEYWGEATVRWHYRDPGEFLKQVIGEMENTAPEFSLLFSTLDDPLAQMAFELRKALLRTQPMPSAFQQIYQVDPVFNLMYPRTKKEMNLLAFCEDLYAFALKIKTDYALYNQHKKMLINLKNKFPQLRKMVNNATDQVIGKPPYLTWDEAWGDLGKRFNASYNPSANKIIGLFTTTDLKGYHPDERFANMIDDALHCFYAAHCNYFLTLDERCAAKASLVFNKLKIPSMILKPAGFVEVFKSTGF